MKPTEGKFTAKFKRIDFDEYEAMNSKKNWKRCGKKHIRRVDKRSMEAIEETDDNYDLQDSI